MNALAALDQLQAAPSMEMLMRFQSALAELPQDTVPVGHHFSKGIYAREVMLKAGQCATGKLHKTRHFIVVCGDCTITTDAGMDRITGFRVIDSMPGIKRAVLAHADTYFVTFHVTDETDVDKIADTVILPDPLPAIEGEMP